MISFEIAEPTSLAAAIALLDPDDPTIRPVGGGTALMLMMKAGVFHPEKLVSLRKIESRYSAITAGPDGLRIGAMTALGSLERSDDVRNTRHSSRALCERCRTFVSATSQPLAALWRTAIRIWTFRRC